MVVFLLSCYSLEEVHGTFSSSGFDKKNHSLWTKSIEIGPGISMPKFFGPRPSQKPKPPLTHGLSTPMNPMNPMNKEEIFTERGFQDAPQVVFFSPATVRRVD